MQETETIRQQFIAHIREPFYRSRMSMRFLTGAALLLLIFLIVVLIGVAIGGSAKFVDVAIPGIFILIGLPFALFFFLDTFGDGAEEALVQVIESDAPKIVGAQFIRIGIHPGVTINTVDVGQWNITVHSEQFAMECVDWLNQFAAPSLSTTEQQLEPQQTEPHPSEPQLNVPEDYVLWPEQINLPAICSRCSEPTENMSSESFSLQQNTRISLSVPVCENCVSQDSRSCLYYLILIIVLLAAGLIPTMLYVPRPGALAGTAFLASLVLPFIIAPMIPSPFASKHPKAILAIKGGNPGEPLYVHFGNSFFDKQFRKLNSD